MNTTLHVHTDIEEAVKWFKIPMSHWFNDYIYIMQEDRCVFVGKPETAIYWIKRNKGKYCKSVYPL